MLSYPEYRTPIFTEDYIEEKNIISLCFNKILKYKEIRNIISEYLSDWCQRSGLKSYSYYYSPSKLVFWFFKINNYCTTHHVGNSEYIIFLV